MYPLLVGKIWAQKLFIIWEGSLVSSDFKLEDLLLDRAIISTFCSRRLVQILQLLFYDYPSTYILSFVDSWESIHWIIVIRNI